MPRKFRIDAPGALHPIITELSKKLNLSPSGVNQSFAVKRLPRQMGLSYWKINCKYVGRPHHSWSPSMARASSPVWGHTKRCCSKRFCQRAKPLWSQYRILMMVRCRLQKANRSPVKGLRYRLYSKRIDNPLIDFLMSVAPQPHQPVARSWRASFPFALGHDIFSHSWEDGEELTVTNDPIFCIADKIETQPSVCFFGY